MPGTQGAASVSGERPLASIVPEEWRASVLTLAQGAGRPSRPAWDGLGRWHRWGMCEPEN